MSGVKYDIKPILPNTDGRVDSLPRPAVNLARRAMQLFRTENRRRHNLEIIFHDNQWLLIVDGANVESLGDVDDIK